MFGDIFKLSYNDNTNIGINIIIGSSILLLVNDFIDFENGSSQSLQKYYKL